MNPHCFPPTSSKNLTRLKSLRTSPSNRAILNIVSSGLTEPLLYYHSLKRGLPADLASKSIGRVITMKIVHSLNAASYIWLYPRHPTSPLEDENNATRLYAK